MFGELLFSFDSLKLGISYKVKKAPHLRCFQQGYKDSNLEMTESESVALPFGDSPSFATQWIIDYLSQKCKPFF